MRLHVIGAGKVGRSLAKAYRASGGKVGYLVNRTLVRAEESVRSVGAGVPLVFDDLKTPKFDGILAITVTDREIESTAKLLENCDITRVSFVFHASGYADSRILRGLCKPYASVHPIFAFGRVVDPWELQGVYYDISGDEKGLEYASNFVRALRGVPLPVDERGKKVLHLAAVIVSNFGLTLMSQAERLCHTAGIDVGDQFLKLVYSTLANVEKVGVKNAATGPVVRGDWAVVKAERELLRELDPDFVDLYDKLVEMTRREFCAECA
ncbi:MAG: DUF2520 domain-containing protein [Thermotogae bacterium]|nr:DUF2520 domain-containing protein [Thermotogota bacterium]